MDIYPRPSFLSETMLGSSRRCLFCMHLGSYHRKIGVKDIQHSGVSASCGAYHDAWIAPAAANGEMIEWHSGFSLS